MHIDFLSYKNPSVLEKRLLIDVLNSKDIDSQLPLVVANFGTNKNSIFYLFQLMSKIPAGPAKYHGSESVLEHVINCAIPFQGDPLGVWMALMHDCGKLLTNPEEWPHHHKHEIHGSSLAWQISSCFDLPKEYLFAATHAAMLHTRGKLYFEMKVTKKVQFLNAVVKSFMDERRFWKLVDIDSNMHISRIALEDMQIIGEIYTPRHNVSESVSAYSEQYNKQVGTLKYVYNRRGNNTSL